MILRSVPHPLFVRIVRVYVFKYGTEQTHYAHPGKVVGARAVQ